VHAQEGNARAAAGEPGAQRRRLQRDVGEQQLLERGGVCVLERRDVLVEQCAGLRVAGTSSRTGYASSPSAEG